MSIWKWIKNLFKKKETPIVVTPPVEPIEEVPTPEEIESFPETTDDVLLKSIIIRTSKAIELKSVCNMIKINKSAYIAVQKETGVPWDVIASCHYRESSLDFNGVLHNGDKIIGTGKLTYHVPKGRGPFSSWEEAAVDAMMIEKNKFPKKWDTSGKLDFCERYNGLGYRNKGVISPYVYAGTTKYVAGLYTSDSEYNSSKIDQRLGCAAIIKGLSV